MERVAGASAIAGGIIVTRQHYCWRGHHSGEHGRRLSQWGKPPPEALSPEMSFVFYSPVLAAHRLQIYRSTRGKSCYAAIPSIESI